MADIASRRDEHADTALLDHAGVLVAGKMAVLQDTGDLEPFQRNIRRALDLIPDGLVFGDIVPCRARLDGLTG